MIFWTFHLIFSFSHKLFESFNQNLPCLNIFPSKFVCWSLFLWILFNFFKLRVIFRSIQRNVWLNTVLSLKEAFHRMGKETLTINFDLTQSEIFPFTIRWKNRKSNITDDFLLHGKFLDLKRILRCKVSHEHPLRIVQRKCSFQHKIICDARISFPTLNSKRINQDLFFQGNYDCDRKHISCKQVCVWVCS